MLLRAVLACAVHDTRRRCAIILSVVAHDVLGIRYQSLTEQHRQFLGEAQIPPRETPPLGTLPIGAVYRTYHLHPEEPGKRCEQRNPGSEVVNHIHAMEYNMQRAQERMHNRAEIF